MASPDVLDLSKEHTLILVKPDGYERGLTGEILARIERKGYILKGLKVKLATPELLAAHYYEHVGKGYYDSLESYMMSGPIVAVAVEGNRVIEGLRTMCGATNPTLAAPGTIRGDFGRDWGGDQIKNLVHSSDSPKSAVREISLWFPELVELPTEEVEETVVEEVED